MNMYILYNTTIYSYIRLYNTRYNYILTLYLTILLCRIILQYKIVRYNVRNVSNNIYCLMSRGS